MGEGKGGEEDGLVPFLWGRKRDPHLGRVIRFRGLVAHKNQRWAVLKHRIFFQFLC